MKTSGMVPGKIDVKDKDGKTLAIISSRCTSVGASKAVGGRAVEYTLRFGKPAWVIK